jgi:hypothetical protein
VVWVGEVVTVASEVPGWRMPARVALPDTARSVLGPCKASLRTTNERHLLWLAQFWRGRVYTNGPRRRSELLERQPRQDRNGCSLLLRHDRRRWQLIIVTCFESRRRSSTAMQPLPLWRPGQDIAHNVRGMDVRMEMEALSW